MEYPLLNSNNTTSKVDYAIIAAMEEELTFFVEKFSNCQSILLKIGALTFKVYDYYNSKVLVTATGIGTTFSACVLTIINSHFNPDFFFFCGTAGGIRNHLKLRDVIVADKAFEAEIQGIFTLLKNTPFENCLKHPIKNEYFPAHYPADPELLKIFHSLEFTHEKVYQGTVVSSNAFPAPLELFKKIKEFDPYSIDMETSAFYQIAWLLNLKVLAIRGVSNILNTDGTDEKIHESDVEGSSFAAASVLFAILNKLIESKNVCNLKLISSS